MEKVTDDIVDEVVYEYVSNPEDVSHSWLGEFVDGDVDFDDFFPPGCYPAKWHCGTCSARKNLEYKHELVLILFPKHTHNRKR